MTNIQVHVEAIRKLIDSSHSKAQAIGSLVSSLIGPDHYDWWFTTRRGEAVDPTIGKIPEAIEALRALEGPNT